MVDRGLGDSKCQAFTTGNESCSWLSRGGGSERSEDSEVRTCEVGEARGHADEPGGISVGNGVWCAGACWSAAVVNVGARPVDRFDASIL